MDDHDANAHHECNVSAALFANVPSAAAALAGLAPQLPHMFASAPMPAGGGSSVTSTIGRDMSWTTAMKDLVDNLIEKAQIHLLRNRVHLERVRALRRRMVLRCGALIHSAMHDVRSSLAMLDEGGLVVSWYRRIHGRPQGFSYPTKPLEDPPAVFPSTQGAERAQRCETADGRPALILPTWDRMARARRAERQRRLFRLACRNGRPFIAGAPSDVGSGIGMTRAPLDGRASMSESCLR
jgi:hypothetical protein